MGAVSLKARQAAPAVTAAIATLALSASARAAGFHFTHMVSLKVTVSDQWTRTQDTGCGPVGTGSLSLSETWRRPVKALPEVDPAAGRWVLLVPGPGGHSALDLSAQPATGTITYANQLSIGGTPIGGNGSCTGSVDTRGCRTYKLGAASNVFGIDRRSLHVLSTVRIGQQIRPAGSCVVGAYRLFNDLDFFAHDLSIRMPRPATLRSNRRVVVTGSNTAHVSFPFTESGFTIAETVTQSAVITLTRIARS